MLLYVIRGRSATMLAHSARTISKDGGTRSAHKNSRITYINSRSVLGSASSRGLGWLPEMLGPRDNFSTKGEQEENSKCAPESCPERSGRARGARSLRSGRFSPHSPPIGCGQSRTPFSPRCFLLCRARSRGREWARIRQCCGSAATRRPPMSSRRAVL